MPAAFFLPTPAVSFPTKTAHHAVIANPSVLQNLLPNLLPPAPDPHRDLGASSDPSQSSTQFGQELDTSSTEVFADAAHLPTLAVV